ncbi:hypothetical protein L1987_45246 [Smallanthus sonchifolius]|uniref:Uncharacterized protein n=1 Tax=Smallanthus sonchifolius TaxID=185202 RepID=A0ACB9GTU0_9ASTR|nr:hypothetical protein L1987_45246 [Smallanthus sonchifolius]
MGKATRWFKGLLGMKDKENVNNFNSGDRKDKKRWSFGKPLKESLPAPPTDAAWLRSYMSEAEKEQNKHAIAVAAATAAAADAAVAAAQAAVAVVRLTNQRRTMPPYSCGREITAAVKIQTVFRSHLARKAFRALKGLVKLQALVRGFLVRKRAAATLHSMQALIRAQAAIRSERARRSFTKDHRSEPPEFRHRKSAGKIDNEINEFHSKRLSAYESNINCYDESPKIVEIDTYRPQSRSRRINTCTSDSGDDSHSHYMNSMPSPLHCQNPACIAIPEFHNLQDFEWGYVGDEYRFSNTAQSTPRFVNSNRSNGPVTPAKSVCGDSFFRPYSNYPSYMASTQSSNAKLRSHSAPKQRPDPGPKKRLSLNDIVASRYSLSGLKMQRTCSQVQEAFNL